MEEASILKDLVRKEYSLGLYEQTIFNVPIWRIVRYHTRLYYINKKTGYTTGNPIEFKFGKPKLKLFSGFWHSIGKKNLSVFFTFNRLAKVNEEFLDKFVDPVIDESDLSQSNYVIVDPRNYCGHYPRVHREHTVSNENRTLLCQIFKYLYKIITPIKYGKEINELFQKVQDAFDLPDNYIKRFYFEIGNFIAYYRYYSLWFSVLKPSHVFVVYREGYFPQIAVCKNRGIPVAEFQHGITLDNTVSFAGEYDPRIDPDYFLVFGEYWKGPQFGMPLDRIINIGWAYSKYLQKTIEKTTEKHKNEILVISSPEISDAILDALKELSQHNGDYSFDIRLHPCESYNDSQQQELESIPKARVVDNKTDSALVLPTYKYVVGENSSVIYEALSVGCKVGMLNMCGLRPAIDLPGIRDNFFVINNCDDFERFLQDDASQTGSKAEFYSAFDNKRFMQFINESM